ncbi:hypothetical protein JVU11DRAFT_7607 [Chiua virens]|nr:hypothetical protein JVU11DRAFT_7607 [Chiua virens]
MPEFQSIQNDVRALGFPMPPSTVYHRHLYSAERSISEGGHSHTTHFHLANGSLFPSRKSLSTPIGLDQPVQHDHASQWPGEMPIILDSSPILPPLTVVNEAHNDNMLSSSLNAYESGWYGTHLSDHATSDPCQTQWPDSSDEQLLLPPAENLGDCPLGAPSACRSSLSTYHAAHSHCSSPSEVVGPSIPFNIPSHRPPGPPLSPHPYPLPGCHVHIAPQDCTPSLRHRRRARAIEYGGLWLDEEELRKALLETDGKLVVLQCLWEQDHSPCHLWIKGDKSYINAHIQKWHGGKPGEEKLEVDCHWSSCWKKMRKESITRHILGVHLGELWECQGCG